jgi:hypothetical protein
MAVNYQYQPRTPEQWEKRAKGSLWESFALDQYTTYQPKKDNSVRILPPTWENAGHYGMDLWVHYSIGPSNATIICLSKMKNQKCSICEARARAEQQGNEKASKEYRPTRRVLAWIIDRKDEQEKQGNVKPILWAMPQTVDRDISKVCRDRETGQLYQIDNPSEGRDVYFDREQKGPDPQNVEYSGFQLSTRTSSVDDKHLQYIIDHPLPTTLNWRSYEEVQGLFEGQPIGTTPQATPPTETPTYAPPPSPPAQTTFIPPPPPPAQMPSPPPPPPPPIAPFVSAYTGANCSVCGQPQYTTPAGHTCVGGHENAAPARVNGAPPPPSHQPAQESSADRLRNQFKGGTFQTGK